MKASVKFREDQKPLFRAKVPLSVLGLPFQSGIVAGESKELNLNLGTFFESGPSIRITYRPNDSWNPFSLIVKTGTGSFGSPAESSLSMSADFSLLGRGNPRFMLHFKPQFGDFSVKKSHSSVFDHFVRPQNGVVKEDEAPIEVAEAPRISDAFHGKKISILSSEHPSAGAIAGLFSGTEVTARTAMPVKGRAVVNFRWGVRIPSELKSGVSDPTVGFSFQKIPVLVMNKIGIEHVEVYDSKTITQADSGSSLPRNADVAEACFTLKRQLDIMQAENGQLKKAMEDLRRDFASARSLSPAVSFDSNKYRDFDRNRSKSPTGKADRRNNETKSREFNGVSSKSTEEDVSEELKKALKGAPGA
ncbi:hypothetical protein UlMin_005161 [Ulmus minor]